MKKKWLIVILIIILILISSIFISKEIYIKSELTRCAKEQGRTDWGGYLHKDLCYMGIAREYERYYICEKVEERKSECYTNVGIEKEDCDNDFVDSDKCYVSVSLKQNDVSLCDRIVEKKYKDRCVINSLSEEMKKEILDRLKKVEQIIT